jgi:hypothetical protein
MLSHGLLPSSKYFLIATPERLYLWRQEQPNGAEAPPEVTADAEQIFQPYFERLEQQPSKIGPEAFEYLVLAWLTDIARSGDGGTSDRNLMRDDSSSQWLTEFSRSLQEADIEMNPH